MVLKNKILSGVLCVVLILCLQEKAFSHTHPRLEVFAENTSDAFGISKRQQTTTLHNTFQTNGTKSSVWNTKKEEQHPEPSPDQSPSSPLLAFSQTNGTNQAFIASLLNKKTDSPNHDNFSEATTNTIGLDAAATITSTSTGSGAWSDAGSWSGGAVPQPGDDVVIAAGTTITVDQNVTCQSITIESGGTLEVADDITLTVTGDWTNNGSFTANTGTVEFNTTGSVLNGDTDFNNLFINAGSDVSSVISIASGSINVTNLQLEQGLLQINGGSVDITHLNDPTTNALHNIIPASAGIELNAGGSISTGNFTIDNKGLIRINSGTATFGNSIGNSVETNTDGIFEVSGGTVSIAGRLHNSAGDESGTAGVHISGGTVILSTAGNGLSNSGSLDITSYGAFEFTGGTIIFENASTAGTAIDLGIAEPGGNGTKTITNGIFQFGNSSTTSLSEFIIDSEIDIPHIEVYDNVDLALGNPLTVSGDLIFGANSQINFNGNPFQMKLTPSFGSIDIPLTDEDGNAIPLSVEITSGTYAADASITISTTNGKPTFNANTSNYLDRSWAIEISGVTNLEYTVLAEYLASDIVGTEADITMGIYGGSLPWVKGSIDTANNEISASGINSSNITFSGITATPPTVAINEGPTAEICNGSSFSINTTSTGDAPLDYSWISTPSGYTATSSSVNVSPTANTTYEVTVTDGNGFTATDQIEITVNPLPTASISGATAVCQDATPPQVTFTGSGGTEPYTFSYSINSGTTETIQTTSGNTVTVDVPTAIDGTFTYTLISVEDANGCTQNQTGSVDVVVHPTPTVDPIDPQFFCNDISTSPIALSGTPSGVVFDISGGTSIGLSAQTDVTEIPSFTTANTTASPKSRTITVTPKANGCTGTPITFEITINPTPTVTQPDDQTLCHGESTSVSFAGNVTSYEWTNDNTAIGLAASGTDNIPSFAVTNATTTPIVANIEVTPVYSNGGIDCYGTPVTFSITVNPLPVAQIAGETTVCQDGVEPEIVFEGTVGTAPFEFTYQVNSGAEQTISTTSGNTVSLPVPTGTPGDFTYTLLRARDANGCEQAQTGAATVKIVVNELPTATIAGTTTVCQDDTSPTITFEGTAGTGPYTFTYNIDGGTNLTASGSTTATVAAPTATAGIFTYNLVSVKDDNGCEQLQTGSATITVKPSPTISGVAQDAPVCEGNPATINLSGLLPNTTFDLTYTIDGGTPINTTLTSDASGNGSFNTVSLAASNHGQTLLITGLTETSSTPNCPAAFSEGVTLQVYSIPVFTDCPADTIYAYTDAGTCTAVVSYTSTASGRPAPDYTFEFSGVTTNSGNGTGSNEIFNLGVTDVTVAATNTCGTATCTFPVKVIDNIAPVTPTISSVNEQCAYTPDPSSYPTTTDLCSGTIVGVPGVTFPYTVEGLSTITWTFTDEAGNSTTANQVVTIKDTQSPTWTSFPANFTALECSSDNTPTATGTPTATDNCSLDNVSYTDSLVSGSCPGRYTIYRKWKAIDSSNNSIQKTQTINVTDNTDPILSCRDTTVASVDDIFSPFTLEGISFSDNCGIDTVYLVDEYYIFETEGQAGFCPEQVIREYIIYDECGNTSNCTQTITVASTSDCSVCQDVVPYQLVNLDNAPDSVWTLTQHKITREGYCCNDEDANSAWGCMSFNVYLDEDAVGLIMRVEKPAPSGVEYYRIDCDTTRYPLGQQICLDGGRFYTLTFCKPGEDKPDYIIESISGAVTTDSLTTRADVECYGDLHVSGLEPSTINWSVKYPAGADYLLDYLDTTDIENPTFYPDSVTPALIIYEVCGTVLGAPECEGNPITDCGEVVVNVLPEVRINLDVDVTEICENDIPPITAELPNEDPSLTYEFAWYDGPDGTGSLVSTTRTYTPEGAGDYSVIVTETTSGIGCSQDISNFNIVYDTEGPIVLAPADSLKLECNDPNNELIIQDWLNEASASDDELSSIDVYNNYIPFTNYCDAVVAVEFWAEDICGNVSKDTAYIKVADTTAPTITDATDASDDCYTLDPNDNADYLAWLANYGGATASDDCDDLLTWSADTATATWSNNPQNNQITVTFAATDDCGNSAYTSATFTVVDTIAPTISCPADTITLEAPAGLCYLENALIPDPTYNDACTVPTLSYSMVQPDGTVVNGTGSVNGLTFYVGYTTVTYTITDDAGNDDSCEFVVFVHHTEFPADAVTCPQDTVRRPADPLSCQAYVTLAPPSINDPCNEIDSIWNNSAYRTSAANASGDYPIDTVSFKWYIRDIAGNMDSCEVVVIVMDVDDPQFTSCPDDVETTINAADCSITGLPLSDPTYTEACGADLTYILSGATTASGTGSASGETFNIGQTLVTYVLTDTGGNTDTCRFTVWVKHEDFPADAITCPADTVRADADPTTCEAFVTLGNPQIYDPCNEIDSVWNNSAYRTSYDDASGTYPIGTTEFKWYIQDLSGNLDSCEVVVIVTDVDDPQFTSCPSNVETVINAADCSVTGFTLTDPTYTEACGADLTYILSGATTGSGNGSASGETFNVGQTLVTYVLTDTGGNTDTCKFTVWVKHADFPDAAVTCPADTVRADADPIICAADVTLGTPQIYDPCNEIDSIWNNSTYRTSYDDASGRYPIGTTEFKWYIQDVSGNLDSCEVVVIVTDVDDPQFTSCPSDVETVINAADCSVTNFTLTDPTYSETCGADLTYILSGATTGSGTGSASGENFNVGQTLVTYVLTDTGGNTDTCEFTVWVKHAEFPDAVVECPDDTVKRAADPISCEAYVSLAPPIITDPCGEIDSLWNNSPYQTSYANASGDYPIDTTRFKWYIQDVSGNLDSCEVVVIVSDVDDPQFTSCPSDVETTINAADCSVTGISLTDPTYTEDCGADLTYILSGATTASGSGSASGETFNVGQTLVTYVLTDTGSNTDTCRFTVWVKRPDFPAANVTCPTPTVEVTVHPDSCETYLTLDAPAISDPCAEIDSVWNDSGYANSASDASGTYPIGETSFFWYIRDVSNNVQTCPVTVTVNDRLPTIACPPDTVLNADFEKTFASGITLKLPTFYDNCPDPTVAWSMVLPDGTVIDTVTSAGINYVPNLSSYNLGVTTITYTITDIYNNTANCSFTVTVLGEPEIDCPNDTTVYVGASNCINTFDPGIPDLLEGVPPIDWTWEMTGATTGSGSSLDTYSLPNPIGTIDFNLGETTIRWIAENEAGADTCFQLITVVDTIPPTFDATPLNECVDLLVTAFFNPTSPDPNVGVDPNLVKAPSPDHYTYKAGNTALDLTNLADNCCAPDTLTINWRIDFSDTPDPLNPSGPALTHPSISGTGQPSTYGSDLLLWGDGVTFTTVTHRIVYWVEDCNGNVSDNYEQSITIRPRPRILKTNY